MAAKDFFESEQILLLMERLKTEGVKFQGSLEIMIDNLTNTLRMFEGVTGENEDFLFDVLNKDGEDLHKYLLHLVRNDLINGMYTVLAIVPKTLIEFAVLKYFPDKFGSFHSTSPAEKARWKWLKRKVQEYNAVFGIVEEKSSKQKAAPKPKTEKRRVSAPLHETGLKYSEYDEDYYAMLRQGGKEGNTIINPRVQPMGGEKDGITVWIPFPPVYKDHKDFRYLDILRGHDNNLLVSERVKKQLDDVIPSTYSGSRGPTFSDKCYIKNGNEYLPYHHLLIPEYQFIDKAHLTLVDGSKGIVYHGDSTSGLEDIVYHSFRPGVMAKMPEAERSIFEVDFHGLGWQFCLKGIKEKFEAAGATGLRFVRSMDMNWREYNAPARGELEE